MLSNGRMLWVDVRLRGGGTQDEEGRVEWTLGGGRGAQDEEGRDASGRMWTEDTTYGVMSTHARGSERPKARPMRRGGAGALGEMLAE